jgi:hypothetical protein
MKPSMTLNCASVMPDKASQIAEIVDLILSIITLLFIDWFTLVAY